MNKFKIIILVCFFGIQFNCISQSGFRVIRKAEKNINKGNLRKAFKLLNRAENMNYGFCGNAHVDALFLIDSLRGIAYLKNKDYKLARASFDSIILLNSRNDIDSIKVITYQSQLGSSYLKSIIDSSLNESFVNCNRFDCYGIIPLKDEEISLRFKIYDDYIIYKTEKNIDTRNKIWIDNFLKSNIYKLIKKGNI